MVRSVSLKCVEVCVDICPYRKRVLLFAESILLAEKSQNHRHLLEMNITGIQDLAIVSEN